MRVEGNQLGLVVTSTSQLTSSGGLVQCEIVHLIPKALSEGSVF